MNCTFLADDSGIRVVAEITVFIKDYNENN